MAPFHMPTAAIVSTHDAPITALLLFALLGVVIGLASAAFVRGLVFAEEGFNAIKSPYLRHDFGMLMVSLLDYGLMASSGHHYVEGVGYATIQAILQTHLAVGIGFLLLLRATKLLATMVCLGSGATGGIFSPALLMGTTLGTACGGAVTLLGPVPGISLLNCTIIGIAAMSGATGATMTAVTMIFEMTRDYHIIMPAIGIRWLMSDKSIYTIKLARRGEAVPEALHANLFLVCRADRAMNRDFLRLLTETGFDDFLRQTPNAAMKYIVVTRGHRISGALRVNTALRRGPEDSDGGVTLGDIAERNDTTARAAASLSTWSSACDITGAAMAIVVNGRRRPRAAQVIGVIDKEHIADSVADSIRPDGRRAAQAFTPARQACAS